MAGELPGSRVHPDGKQGLKLQKQFTSEQSTLAESPRDKKIPRRVLDGTPKGTRTPDSTVRGWRLNRLTIGAYLIDCISIL